MIQCWLSTIITPNKVRYVGENFVATLSDSVQQFCKGQSSASTVNNNMNYSARDILVKQKSTAYHTPQVCRHE